MNIYDTANKLASELKQDEKVKKYLELKEVILADETNKTLMKKYKKLQFEAQTLLLSGGKLSDEQQEEIKKLGELLQFNKEISEFLSLEYFVNQILTDIYRIIGEAVDIDLSFME